MERDNKDKPSIGWNGDFPFLSILSSIQHGISVLNAKMDIVYVNPWVENRNSHSMPLVGKKCYQAYYGFSDPCRPCPAHRAFITRSPHHDVIPPRGSKEGSSGWLEVYSFPWQNNPEEKIQGTVNYIRDITNRWRAEEAKDYNLKRTEKAFNGILLAITYILEEKDPHKINHPGRVSKFACAIGRELELPQNSIEGLRVMGSLHDIGEMIIPLEILCKPGKLSSYEFDFIKAHPQIGYDILKGIEFPWPVAEAVFQHHERINGSGYPLKLSKKSIISEAKILAVADVIEAITSPRPYRPALGLESAMEEILRNTDILYDSEVVNACLTLFKNNYFDFK